MLFPGWLAYGHALLRAGFLQSLATDLQRLLPPQGGQSVEVLPEKRGSFAPRNMLDLDSRGYYEGERETPRHAQQYAGAR